MLSNHSKIKAFTLIEMIVVLLITIIVIGLAFSILRLVQKQMGSIEENYEKTTEINLFRQAVSIDMATYPYLYYNHLTNKLHLENELNFIDYIFEEEWVIREQDTFNLKLENKTFYFDGLEVLTGEIDALELETIKDQGAKTIFAHQENAANEYMY